ncbi:NAD(P)/FAD-dependent oxidoreductase [Parasphingorhabdus halotolerans]|uniref:FAD-binding oxidoreductase n=1 Tax=Parasphingorhabdus halotolerans TaxID=2725558 RepID=A0A6H2DM74_9SPHN|nr:FAD-dependent oxidoreductase [Parasphingorhabdus halotolerans]QJB69055.1 FAD-binding oxidoreductase [Parasphingorhabdus halotolerans]
MNANKTFYDFAIIGAGIAGASIASELGGDASALLLEAESQPGYHATGRSAAFWTETYGGPQIQPLTTASRQFLQNPHESFSERSFLTRRGAINIGHDNQAQLAEKFMADFNGSGVRLERWGATEIARHISHLKSGWKQAVFEPDCFDIDVAGLHQAYLADARRKGVMLLCNARVDSIVRQDGMWELQVGDSQYYARKLVNAAGAWADYIAELAGLPPLGIKPLRRTMVQLETDPPAKIDGALIVALDGSFYFKPETGGSYWLSPHDEIPSAAVDAAPEELDVAIAIDRFQSVKDVEVKKVSRKWAGLRSFAPDRLPVYGFDPRDENFFWFAGQGGFGIQTAPAAARLTRSILLDQSRDEMVNTLDAALYHPRRFR